MGRIPEKMPPLLSRGFSLVYATENLVSVVIPLDVGNKGFASTHYAYVRENGCWEWQGAHTVSGYARIGNSYLHRLIAGAKPGEVVRHTCDHPWCIRPDHLLVGTQGENIKDAWDRGRRKYSYPGGVRKTHCFRGHEYDGWYRNGRRRCLECQRIHKKRRKLNV